MPSLHHIATRMRARIRTVEPEWAIAGALAVPVAARAYLGTFVRYALDDFCWLVPITWDGFLAFQGRRQTRMEGRRILESNGRTSAFAQSH